MEGDIEGMVSAVSSAFMDQAEETLRALGATDGTRYSIEECPVVGLPPNIVRRAWVRVGGRRVARIDAVMDSSAICILSHVEEG